MGNIKMSAGITGLFGLCACLGILTIGFSSATKVGENNTALKSDNPQGMGSDELLNRFRRLKEFGLDVTGEIPPKGARANAYKELLSQRMDERGYNMGVAGDEIQWAAGKLHIYVVRNPDAWHYQTNRVDHYVNDLEGDEWIRLFRDTLRCPMEIAESLVSVEESTNPRERYRVAFQNSIPQYPLLGRMWDTYADAIYDHSEIKQLRDECSAVRAGTSDVFAGQGLEKLIDACDEALESGCGLYLASD